MSKYYNDYEIRLMRSWEDLKKEHERCFAEKRAKAEAEAKARAKEEKK